jgi:hypothetical protein
MTNFADLVARHIPVGRIVDWFMQVQREADSAPLVPMLVLGNA